MPRRSGLSVAPRFRWECLTIQTVNWFPAPTTSHVACGFPALRAPAHFTPRFMRPIRPERLPPARSVLREESKRSVQPVLVPPLPAEASTLARPGQMVPYLLLYPSDPRSGHAVDYVRGGARHCA